MPVEKKLAHIVLQTGQVPAMRDWYLQVLDAHVVYDGGFLVLMTFDDEHHRLGIVQLPEPVERGPMTVGLAHSAYTFATLADLLTKYTELAAVGIYPHVPVQHGPTTSLYYCDPDDNMVELQIDNFGTPDQATEYFYSEDYRTDALGPSFEPDLMLTALQAGTPATELTTRAWARTCAQRDVRTLLRV